MDEKIKEQLDPQILALGKTLKSLETGGSPDPYKQYGDNGASYGAFQWNNGGKKLAPGELPSHWKADAKTYLGDENAEMTPANQNKLVYYKIKDMRDNQGLTPREIDALWNGAHKGADGKYYHNSKEREQKFLSTLPKYIGGFSDQPGGAAGAVINTVDQSPDTRGLGDKLKDEFKYAVGGSNQETPTGLASIIQGGNKALQGDVGSGLADVGRGALNIAGAAGGAVGDLIGAGVSKLIPDDIERSVGNTFGKVLDNPEVSDILQKVHTWKEANPKSANAAGDIFNVVTTLIPAGKAASAAKGAVVGGIAAGIGGTTAGRALLKQTAQEGIDLFASARNVLNAAPKSMWDRVLHPISGKSQFADDLAGLAGEMAQQARKEMMQAMAKENLRVNMSQVADIAVNNARLAFDGDGNVVKSLGKAFGSALDKSKDVGMADLMRYAESPNANQYVQKAIDQLVTNTSSKAIKQARQKAMQAEASRRLFEMLSGTASQSTTRNLAGQAIEGAGTHLGGQFGSAGAYLGNKAGEQIAKSLLGNKKGLISKALLEKATRGGSLKRAVKKGLLPIAVNLGN